MCEDEFSTPFLMPDVLVMPDLIRHPLRFRVKPGMRGLPGMREGRAGNDVRNYFSSSKIFSIKRHFLWLGREGSAPWALAT